MCGIIGIYSHQPVAEDIYNSLIYLQHRGQDAAGIITCQQRFDVKHGLGLVQEIFNDRDVLAMQGNIGIGHTRYPTAGGNQLSDVQPIWLGSPRGIALAHNGNLTNYQALHRTLIHNQHRHLNTSTDSELLLHLLSDALHTTVDVHNDGAIFFSELCDAVQSVFNQAEGSYSVVSVVMGKGLLAFRDPHGIRPLVIGVREDPDGQKDYVLASETTMFYALGFRSMGDVKPGEVVFINQSGQLFRQLIQSKTFSPCIFEYVYFARPDSILDEVNVYRARMRMGENLARRWKEKYPDLLPDVVIPVPFTSNTAAMSFAHALGVRYSEGLYKNPFIGRTFIMSGGKKRSQQVRYKLTPQHIEIKNKKVLLLDDSIVRGTTSREIVTMMREFNAQSVYFASACPPLISPCLYGIDIPSSKELISANYTIDEMREHLNVDALLFQDEGDLVEAVTRKGNHQIKSPCMACMNGRYITGNIDQLKIKQLEENRQRCRGEVCVS